MEIISRHKDASNKTIGYTIKITTNIVNEMPQFRLEELKLALEDRFATSGNGLYLALKEM